MKKVSRKLIGIDGKQKGEIVATFQNVSLSFSVAPGEQGDVSPHAVPGTLLN